MVKINPEVELGELRARLAYAEHRSLIQAQAIADLSAEVERLRAARAKDVEDALPPPDDSGRAH